MADSADYGWADAFTPMPGVPAGWRLAPGPDEFLVRELSKSPFPHRRWRESPLGPEAEAWAFLDGGVHHVKGFGWDLDEGVRVFGWNTMRWVSYGLRLNPPVTALPGENGVPSYADLETKLLADDAGGHQHRADLLSAVDDAEGLRQFVQRTFGDRGLSSRRRPTHPATGEWGRHGFTVASAAMLHERFAPDEAADRARRRLPELSGDTGDERTFRMSLQLELSGNDEGVARALLREAKSSPSAVTTDSTPTATDAIGDAGTASRSTLAMALALRSEEDEDFEPDDIEGESLVSLWWDNDTGMPNWCGGEDLVLLADGSAVVVHSGDSEGGVEPINLPADAELRAEAIASWLAGDLHSGFAALDLEPLDPNNTLSPDARTEWDEAITASNSYVSLDVGALEPAVRAALGRDPVYARVRDALARTGLARRSAVAHGDQGGGGRRQLQLPRTGRVGGPRALARGGARSAARTHHSLWLPGPCRTSPLQLLWLTNDSDKPWLAVWQPPPRRCPR